MGMTIWSKSSGIRRMACDEMWCRGLMMRMRSDEEYDV